jgi:phage gp45-like
VSEISALQSQLDRVKTRLRMQSAPVLINTIDDSGPIQIAQLRVNDTPEVIDNVSLMQLYGFSSVAPVPSDATALFVMGERSNPVIVATNNQAARLQNQQPGEMSLYTDEGDTLGLNRGNIINVNSKNTVNVNGQNKVNTNTAIATTTASDHVLLDTPVTRATGDILAKGVVDAAEGFFSNGTPIGGGAPGPPGPAGPAGPPGPPGPAWGDIDGGNASTNYGAVALSPIDGGHA